MACRLHNTHDKTLGIDLRGGEVLMLPPHTTSRAIVEEALYDNHHLPEWERAGWIRRIPARMANVIAEAANGQALDARRKESQVARIEAKTKANATAEEGKAADDGKAAGKPRKKRDKKSQQ